MSNRINKFGPVTSIRGTLLLNPRNEKYISLTYYIDMHCVGTFYTLSNYFLKGLRRMANQWANSIGATVIGTVGSQAKAELALKHGYQHIINYNTENVVERVMEITGGAKLPEIAFIGSINLFTVAF